MFYIIALHEKSLFKDAGHMFLNAIHILFLWMLVSICHIIKHTEQQCH